MAGQIFLRREVLREKVFVRFINGILYKAWVNFIPYKYQAIYIRAAD
jgi:hypothetical protein